jgi:hypothetical protein
MTNITTIRLNMKNQPLRTRWPFSLRVPMSATSGRVALHLRHTVGHGGSARLPFKRKVKLILHNAMDLHLDTVSAFAKLSSESTLGPCPILLTCAARTT